MFMVIVLTLSMAACSSEPAPTPAESTPAPAEPAPAPVEPEPTPVEPEQAPAEPSTDESTEVIQIPDADYFVGTWEVVAIKNGDESATVEELEATGYYDISETGLVFISDMVFYFYQKADVSEGKWSMTDEGVLVGTTNMVFKEDTLYWDVRDSGVTLIFQKTSDRQDKPVVEVEPEETAETPEGIRPEFKAAMDAYESFYDEYCAFLTKYQANPTDLTLLLKYAELMAEAEKMNKAFAEWETADMNQEEMKYYLEVTTRVQQKMIELF